MALWLVMPARSISSMIGSTLAANCLAFAFTAACNDIVVIPARLRAMREVTVAPPALTAVSEGHQVVHTCSFCGKSNLTTKVMVVGDDATICNECIAVCVKIEREWNERKVAEAGGEMTVSGKAPRGRKAKKAGHVPGVGDVEE
jgi:hypothetical protein